VLEASEPADTSEDESADVSLDEPLDIPAEESIVTEKADSAESTKPVDKIEDIGEIDDISDIADIADIDETPAKTESLPSSTTAKKASDFEIPSELKKELKNILGYMDQLLESLPEEKIEEFAKSQYFDSYKKLFKELGLV